MSIYEYKAIDISGKIHKATLEYNSQDEVINYLKIRGLMAIEINYVDVMNTNLTDLKIFKPKVTTKDLSIFCRQFAVIIESGIPISTALDILRHQIENPTLKKIVYGVYENIQKGSTLSEAMSRYNEFPIIMISMIEVGETSGKLNLSLKQLSNQYDKELSIEHKIKKAMTYPAIISILMFIVIIAVITFVVPSYMSMFEEMGAELPQITIALMNLSYFIINKWYLIIIAVAISIITFKVWICSKKGRYIWDSFILKLPIIGNLIKKINTERFSSTMSLLLASGVPMLNSLETIQKVLTNTVIQKSVGYFISEVKQGTALSEPIEISGLFPYMLSSMVRIGQESGSLDYLLSKTAEFYSDELSMNVEQLTTFIEPIMTIIIATVMGFIMLAILMPTFSLASQM